MEVLARQKKKTGKDGNQGAYNSEMGKIERMGKPVMSIFSHLPRGQTKQQGRVVTTKRAREPRCPRSLPAFCQLRLRVDQFPPSNGLKRTRPAEALVRREVVSGEW